MLPPSARDNESDIDYNILLILFLIIVYPDKGPKP